MDIQAIEILLDDLGFSLPANVARARATLDKLSVLDVSMQPEVTRANLAGQLRGLVDRGEEVDVVAMVRANRANADNAEAATVLQIAIEDAQRVHELAFRGGGGLIPVVRAAIEDVYARVRALPRTTPTDASEAVHADEKTRKVFVKLQELATRHSQLRRLHRLLIADDVAQEVALILFADTKRDPNALPSRIQPPEPAGPGERLMRVQWLSQPDSDAWTPTAREINDRYTEFVSAVSLRMTGASTEA